MLSAMLGDDYVVNLLFARLPTLNAGNKNFEAVLDQMLPPAEALKNKKLIFMDYAVSGSSLINFRSAFTVWKNKQVDPSAYDFETLAFVEWWNRPRIKNLQKIGILVFQTKAFVSRNFLLKRYRNFSEFRRINASTERTIERESSLDKLNSFEAEFPALADNSTNSVVLRALGRYMRSVYSIGSTYDDLKNGYRDLLRKDSAFKTNFPMLLKPLPERFTCEQAFDQ